MSEGRISIFEQKEEKVDELNVRKFKKTGNVHVTERWFAFAWPLSLWKSNIRYNVFL